MASASSVVFAGIAPHPPIMVPEVGRDAIVDVRGSIEAMAVLTERVIGSGAATGRSQLDDTLLNEITRTGSEQNLPTIRIKGFDLDHGTAVPLYFLQRNGWNGRVIALGYSFLSNEDHLRFGNCIRQAIEKLDR